MSAARLATRHLSDRSAPPCPHCGGAMDAATVTLDALVEALPLVAFVATGLDGYASAAIEHGALSVDCPSCLRPSAFALDRKVVKLVAMRTPADERLIGGGGAHG